MNTFELIEKVKRNLMLKNYSERSIQNYISNIQKFLHHFKVSPQNISSDQIGEYLLQFKNINTHKQIRASLSVLYFELKQYKKIKMLPYPKKEIHIPNILSIQEVDAVLRSINNIKHRAIIQIIYSCALRISECINLKFEDINFSSHQIHIKQGKGKKDRIIPVPDDTLNLIGHYYNQYKPKEYLFNGQSEPFYSQRSIQNILKEACKKAGVKRIKVHELRHSRSTHLLDNGISLEHLRKFLGHNSIKTTQIYLHTSIQSMTNIFKEADKKIKSFSSFNGVQNKICSGNYIQSR